MGAITDKDISVCRSGAGVAPPRRKLESVREALIWLVIPESRSDVRDPATLHFGALCKSHWVPAFAGMT